MASSLFRIFSMFSEEFNPEKVKQTMDLYGPWRGSQFRHSHDSDFRVSANWLGFEKASENLKNIVLSNMPEGSKLIDFDGDDGWARLILLPSGKYQVQETEYTSNNRELIHYFLYLGDHEEEDVPQKFLLNPPSINSIKWKIVKNFDEADVPKTWANAVNQTPYRVDWEEVGKYPNYQTKLISSKYTINPDSIKADPILLDMINSWKESKYKDEYCQNSIIDWLNDKGYSRDSKYLADSIKQINTIIFNLTNSYIGRNNVEKYEKMRIELFDELINYLMEYR